MSDDLSYLLDVCTLSPLLTAEQEIMYGKRIQAGIALTDPTSEQYVANRFCVVRPYLAVRHLVVLFDERHEALEPEKPILLLDLDVRLGLPQDGELLEQKGLDLGDGLVLELGEIRRHILEGEQDVVDAGSAAEVDEPVPITAAKRGHVMNGATSWS